MALARIAAVEGMMAILLPQDIAEESGLQIGDNVPVTMNDRFLVVTPPLSEEEREARIQAAMERLFTERAEVYRALAKGEED